ncbi:zinc finger and SCAN domain-containing protein 2-like isoform X2 [Haliotis rubra]|uniref:zinc finger and SCAN domain-containing protein 2-like isoform X2 n=1 Tax=Haliotis rubra TaxID=36100 RepID=UPI001EE5BE4F|nr:zinc finger and SCAN domain-containing protein 2-like isoform X2 [Haliotis rubra]
MSVKMAAPCDLREVLESTSTVKSEPGTTDDKIIECDNEDTRQMETALSQEAAPVQHMEGETTQSTCIQTAEVGTETSATMCHETMELTSEETHDIEELLTEREDEDEVTILPTDPQNSYRVLMEVGVQANDYDIERRSGKLPARQRIIPAKFRDFKNPVNIDEDTDDSDFDPETELVPVKKKSTGKRGRPRKTASDLPPAPDVKEDSIEALGRIIRTSTGFKCPRCGKTFTQKGNLKVHMWTHTTARPFACDYEGCGKSYRSNESLRRHKLVHMGIKPFECADCSKKFSSSVTLKEHMTIHSNTKPYMCEVCNRSFRQVSCFRRHLITHTNNTPFACQICSRRFSQMVYLRSHMKMHTGERPFQCDKCSKAFAHQSDLARHKIIHTGVKPYECEVCSAKFSDPSSRRRHFREHMSTKPFECSLCGEKFKRQNQIRVHMSRWHGGQLKQGEQVTMAGGQPMLDPSDTTVVNIMMPGTQKKSSGEIDVEALANQRKIVSLIQNLNTGFVVQEVEIASPSNQGGGDKDQLETETEIGPQNEQNQIEIPLSDLPLIQSENGNVEKTVIAIAEVQEDGKGDNGALPVEAAYQIIQELAEGNDEQQIYEIQYQTADNQLETSIVQLDNRPSNVAAAGMSEQDMAAATLSADTTDGVDYVKDPDFASQEYFNWLSNFTELCKVLKIPLSQVLFQKISQVHKSITDFMAMPSGVLNDKENFRVLMSISKDLNNIISNHLAYVMDNIDST